MKLVKTLLPVFSTWRGVNIPRCPKSVRIVCINILSLCWNLQINNGYKNTLPHKLFMVLKWCLKPQFNQVPHSVILRSRYTSGRTALAPYGHRGYRFVEIGNLLSSRTALMILVATWRGLRWLLKQPSGSFLKELPRFQWLWDLLQARQTRSKETHNPCLFLSFQL